MAEFQMEQGGGSSPGGGPNPSSRKKGFKVDKTIIYVVGAVVIVIFLLIRGKNNNQAQETPAETYITDGYPDNNVNTQAQLSNFQDIMTGQVDATLNGFSSDLNSELNQLKIDIGEQNKALNEKTSADYQAKLDAIAKQNEQLAAQIKNASSSPAPAPVYTPPPAPAPAPAAPSGYWYTIKRGDTLSQIAKTAYGGNPYNGNITRIQQANAGVIKDVNKIYAGNKIFIPR